MCYGFGAERCQICPGIRELDIKGQDDNCLDYGSCVCPNGTYSSSYEDNFTDISCKKCDPKCKTCKGPNFTDCLSCFSFKLIKEGQCVCPNGYDDGEACKSCHISCLTCNGKSEFNCTDCLLPSKIIDGTCECPKGNVFIEGICQRCHYSCETCNKTEIDGCVTCPSGRISKDGQCVCPSYTQDIENEQTCKKKIFNDSKVCAPGCLQCESPSVCLKCFDGIQLQNNGCACDFGFFLQKDSCQKCNPNCADCSGPGPFDCISKCTSPTRGMNGSAISGQCMCGEGYEEIFEKDCQRKSEVHQIIEALQSSVAQTSGVASSVSALSGSSGGGGGVGVLGLLEISQFMSLSENMRMEFPLSLDKNYLSSLGTLRMDGLIESGSEGGADANKTSGAYRILTDEGTVRRNINSKLINIIFTFGVNVLTILLTLAAMILAKVSSKIRIKAFFDKLVVLIRWRLFFCVFRITSIAQIIFIFTELKNKSNSSFMGITATVWALLLMSVHIFIFGLTVYILNFTNFDNENVREHYGFLLEGVGSIFMTKKNYNTFSFLRKVFNCAICVFLADKTDIQTVFLILNQALFIAYVLRARPFQVTSHQWLQVALETLLLLFYIALAVLYKIQENEGKILLGWTIIAILLITQVSMLLAAIVNFVKLIRGIFFKKRDSLAYDSQGKGAMIGIVKDANLIQENMLKKKLGRRRQAANKNVPASLTFDQLKTPTKDIEFFKYSNMDPSFNNDKEQINDIRNSTGEVDLTVSKRSLTYSIAPVRSITENKKFSIFKEKRNSSLVQSFKTDYNAQASRLTLLKESLKVNNVQIIEKSKEEQNLTFEIDNGSKSPSSQYKNELDLQKEFASSEDEASSKLPFDTVLSRDGLVKNKNTFFFVEKGTTITVLKLIRGRKYGTDYLRNG